MEITRRFKVLLVSAALILVASLDSGVISAPAVRRSISSIGTDIMCDACSTIAGALRDLVKTHASEELIVATAIELCEKFNIEDNYVCKEIVPEFKGEVIGVLASTALSSKEICGTILGSSCGNTYDPFNQTWNITIPGNKPRTVVKTPNTTAPMNRILHLSDIHWDPQYTVGLTSQCNEPLCCRPPNAKADKPEDAAGPWGNPHCDMPYRSVINLMERLHNTSHEFDWVYLTGDLPAHNDWTQTRNGQMAILENITSLFKKYIPGKPVYFSIGNHESDPVNSFPPPFVTGDQSESWLYDKAADQWADWLTPEAVKTLKYGGFYAVEILPDLKVISLQTNFCNTLNWWLLINNTDPGGMLKWMANELLESEKKGQKVHILGHIPPGNDNCVASWSRGYLELTDRFQNIIMGHFYGHVHTDAFVVLYNDDQLPIGTAYLSPSFTTYTSLNPGYRIYDIEGTYKGSTRVTLDHHTYIMDITEANLSNEPKWELEYSAKSTYNMTSLLAGEWSSVIDKFIEDDSLFQKYYRYFSKSFSHNECNGKCKCSKLTDMAYNKKIKCSSASEEEVRQYKLQNELLC